MLHTGFALLLVLIANSAPILIRQLPYFRKSSYPLDFYLQFHDGSRWLGDNKTWRGLFAAIVLTAICSALIQTGWRTGVVVALLAMLGDSLSSFIKRRLGLPPSAMALGLDQIPESLLPLVYLQFCWQIGWWQVGLLVVCFFVLELSISRVLYYLHIRKHPY
ncbi:MAG: CDP-archaeol synthase [Gammaproteobacteria bacterium]|jgi:CDP-diglyceride synthetase